MKSFTYALATAAALAIVAMITVSPAQSAQCSATVFGQTVPFTCPDPIPGAKGDQGDKGDKGDPGVAGLDGKDAVDGKDGKDGVSFDDHDLTEGLATVGALNIPHVENKFAASLNGGFYDSDTAVGVGAGYRFDKTWQFGGSVAVGTNGGSVAGKAALTGQW